MKKYIVREDHDFTDGLLIFKTGFQLWQLYAYLSKVSKKYGYTKILKHEPFYCVTTNTQLTIVRLTNFPF